MENEIKPPLYEGWLAPDESGQLYLHAKMLLTEETLKWIKTALHFVIEANCKYINPLFSSTDQQNQKIRISPNPPDSF